MRGAELFMRRVRLVASLLILSLLIVIQGAWAITADEIMNQVDEYQYLKSAKVESEMTIVKGNRQMRKEMSTYLKGNDYALTRFTNPRDRNNKFLKRGDDLWMFFPNAEEIVKISGHMLKKGMMGSDFSYQDMMESTKLSDLYDFKIIREEEVGGRPVYVIEGVKKADQKPSYYRRINWIDKQRKVVLKEKLYAESGRLLKEIKARMVKEIDGRWIPTYQIIDDKLKKGSYTEYRIKVIEFNLDISEDRFSLRTLKN